MKLEFSDGEWAEVIDPDDVTEAQSRALFKSMSSFPTDIAAVSGEQLGSFLDLYDEAIALVTTDWSLMGPDGEKLPITAATIVNLPRRYYRPLRAHAGPIVDDTGTDFGPNPDRASPTPT